MANVIIYSIGSNNIQFYIKDCILEKNNIFHGSNCKISGIKLDKFNYIWTNDEVNPIYDDNESIIGYDKNVDEITILNDNTRRIIPTREDYRQAIKTKENIAQFDFDQIDTFIDLNITDLESAKDVLKFFGKAILALCKEIDYKSK